MNRGQKLSEAKAAVRLARLSSVGKDGRRRFPRPIRRCDFNFLRRLGFKMVNIGVCDPLSIRQMKFVRLYATGNFTIQQCAAQVGCNPCTYYRWLWQNPLFREALDTAIAHELRRLDRCLSSRESRAVVKWEEILDGVHGDAAMYKATIETLRRGGLLPRPGQAWSLRPRRAPAAAEESPGPDISIDRLKDSRTT